VYCLVLDFKGQLPLKQRGPRRSGWTFSSKLASTGIGDERGIALQSQFLWPLLGRLDRGAGSVYRIVRAG